MKLPKYLFPIILIISSCAPATSISLVPSLTAGTSAAATASPPFPPTPDPTGTVALPPAPTALLKLDPFGAVNISSNEIAFDVKGDGENVDSIAFWEAPDPAGSLMFVTSKGNASIEVYQYPFQSQLTTLSCGSASNGVWVDQDSDLLYVTARESSDVCTFNLPELDRNSALSFSTQASSGKSEPNLAMLNLPDGQGRVYVSYDDIVYYHDAGTGKSLGSFKPAKGLETMYGDDYYQVLYIPDEGDRSGIYIYDKDGNEAGPKFGDRSIFDSDAEGIWVYTCPPAGATGTTDSGEGLIVVSDQKSGQTDFEVFNRKTKAYLGKINISGVNNTDGIAITQQASPAYPSGLLAVIDDDTSTVGVGWNTIFAKTGLSCGG